jgi:hypothetical protein
MTLVIVLFIVAIVRAMLVMPKTSIEEMNHLLSLDEDNLLDRQPKSESEEANALYNFSMIGEYIHCHYTARYEDGKYVQIVNIIALSTKARLCVEFGDDSLTYFEFKERPTSTPEIYFEERYLRLVSGTQQFLAQHALATAQHIAAKKFLEARSV